jgi:phenolic acid decarboxylase
MYTLICYFVPEEQNKGSTIELHPPFSKCFLNDYITVLKDYRERK